MASTYNTLYRHTSTKINSTENEIFRPEATNHELFLDEIVYVYGRVTGQCSYSTYFLTFYFRKDRIFLAPVSMKSKHVVTGFKN